MRQVTAMPISTGLPRQSLIFWRELFRVKVMILRESFLPVVSTSREALLSPVVALMPSVFTSPLWLKRVLAAGFTPVQKGLT